MREEMLFTMRVAVLLEQQTPRAEIARRFDVKPAQVALAVERLQAIAPMIDRDADG